MELRGPRLASGYDRFSGLNAWVKCSCDGLAGACVDHLLATFEHPCKHLIVRCVDPGLEMHACVAGRRLGTTPSPAPAGSGFLVACADPHGRVVAVAGIWLGVDERACKCVGEGCELSPDRLVEPFAGIRVVAGVHAGILDVRVVEQFRDDHHPITFARCATAQRIAESLRCYVKSLSGTCTDHPNLAQPGPYQPVAKVDRSEST